MKQLIRDESIQLPGPFLSVAYHLLSPASSAPPLGVSHIDTLCRASVNGTQPGIAPAALQVRQAAATYAQFTGEPLLGKARL
jgi:hypothetical protein